MKEDSISPHLTEQQKSALRGVFVDFGINQLHGKAYSPFPVDNSCYPDANAFRTMPFGSLLRALILNNGIIATTGEEGEAHVAYAGESPSDEERKKAWEEVKLWNMATVPAKADTANYLARALHVAEVAGYKEETIPYFMHNIAPWLLDEVIIGIHNFVPNSVEEGNAIGKVTGVMISKDCMQLLTKWSGLDIAALLPH